MAKRWLPHPSRTLLPDTECVATGSGTTPRAAASFMEWGGRPRLGPCLLSLTVRYGMTLTLRLSTLGSLNA